MTTVYRHIQPFPTHSFECTTCGCRFKTDEYHLIEKQESYPDIEAKKMVTFHTKQWRAWCPECRYLVCRDVTAE